jgi:periplasmic divalent cation tolerance protein
VNSESSEACVVLVAAPAGEAAPLLARTLVEERLAACVNVLPGVSSVFRWEEAVEEAAESLLLVKTRRDRLERVFERIVELHPYEVPEVVALPIVDGLGAYLDWVVAESGAEG